MGLKWTTLTLSALITCRIWNTQFVQGDLQIQVMPVATFAHPRAKGSSKFVPNFFFFLGCEPTLQRLVVKDSCALPWYCTTSLAWGATLTSETQTPTNRNFLHSKPLSTSRFWCNIGGFDTCYSYITQTRLLGTKHNTLNLGVVYTMDHEVVSRRCKICDWWLNSS